jgi:hypothetical protein
MQVFVNVIDNFEELCATPPAECWDENGEHTWEEGCQAEAVWKRDNMWSPRRHHKVLVHRQKLYIMGGRAREYARMSDRRLIGGIIGPRVSSDLYYSSIREEILLKNDVWVSNDGAGVEWTLVTPGCHDPQQDILAATESWKSRMESKANEQNIGVPEAACLSDNDCYGVAECTTLTGMLTGVCVCPMWSPRENHAVAVQHLYTYAPGNNSTIVAEDDYMYVVGGFVSARRSFCGDHR